MAPLITTALRLEPLTDSQGILTDRWYVYFRDQNADLAAAPTTLKKVTLLTQSASIGTTAIPTSSLSPGLYRLTWYYRVTTAASTSCSFILTMLWTDQANACSYSWPANTGNTVTTTDSNTRLVTIDQASPISYSTTYVSVGATAMVYKLILLLEMIGA